MKTKRNFILLSAITLTLTFGCLLSFGGNDISEVSAAEYISVDITDDAEAEIRSYYSSLDTLSESKRKGNELISSLHDIIDGNESISYSDVYDWMRITDRDWELSPLSSSELAMYNISNTTDNPKMHLLYRNDNGLVSASEFYAEGSITIHTFDKEHVWAQSKGNFGTADGAGTDLHHLIAADSKNNSAGHISNDFGDTTLTDPNVGDNPYNKTGKLETITYKSQTGSVYEPIDSDKGDIARALFYMATRYSKYVSSSDPYLLLVDELTPSTIVTSSETTPGKCGVLETLLEWHTLDPVDDYEIHRNNLIANNVQGNRNPFIDYPSWVSSIWGNGGVATAASDEVSQIGDNKQYLPARNGRLMISSKPTKSTYTVGENLDLSGLSVNLLKSDASTISTTDFITSYDNGVKLETPGEIKIFVSSTKYEVLGNYFSIKVNPSSGSVEEKEVVVNSTGFETTDGFVSSSSYKGNRTIGPADKTWNFVNGNVSTTKPVLAGNMSARLRIFNDKVFSSATTTFTTLKATHMSFIANAKIQNSSFVSVLYSIDNGSTWKEAYTDKECGTAFTNKAITISDTEVGNYDAYLSKSDQGKADTYTKFKIQMGPSVSFPTSSSYEMRFDSIKIYGMSDAEEYKSNIRLVDMPRKMTYYQNELFSIQNMNIARYDAEYTSEYTSRYLISPSDRTKLNTLGKIKITLASQDEGVSGDTFYVTVIEKSVSPDAELFANHLSTYKTCSQYNEAYTALSAEYEALSSTAKEELKSIYLSDYSYEDYTNNHNSYDGISKTDRYITAHDKWQMIVRLYETNHSKTSYYQAPAITRNHKITIIAVSASIGLVTTIVIGCVLIKKRKRLEK